MARPAHTLVRDQRVSQCPNSNCDNDRVVYNGSYHSKHRGLVRRLICRACGHEWKEFEKTSTMFNEAKILDDEEPVLQAFALVAMGVPLDQVEYLTGRKSETIRDRMLRCFEKQKLWPKIADVLVFKCGLRPREIQELSELLGEILSGAKTFHALAQLKASLHVKPRSGPKQLRHRILEPRFRELARSHGFREERINRLWRQEGKAIGSKPLRVQRVREELKRRIEALLGCQIAVTPSGDYYRSENDPRVTRWLAEVERFDLPKHGRWLEQLSEMERWVFAQVRRPNDESHCYARLEGSIGERIEDPWLERMTPECLAKGLGFELGWFIAVLKLIADLLCRAKRSHFRSGLSTMP